MSDPFPHLSHSRISKYLLCPRQYQLYYVENLRPRCPSASLVFGQTMHGALAHLFQTGEDPVQWFQQAWDEIRQAELSYGKRDSWERLRDAGEALLAKFVSEELSKIQRVEAVERPFQLDIAGLELPFVGIIDLVAEVEGARTVVDFKTSGSSYGEHEAALSDQLTAYELAEPEAQKAALCVLVKTKGPKIEWHVVERRPEDFTEYLAKAELVGREVRAGRFYKRPGAWCAWCDYLPVCMGDREKAEKTLMRL